MQNEWCPPEKRHGFDFWYAYDTYDYHMRPLYWSTDAARDEFHYVDQWEPEHEADMALRYLANSPSVPDTSDRWGKYYRQHIKNQLAMVTGIDKQFEENQII